MDKKSQIEKSKMRILIIKIIIRLIIFISLFGFIIILPAGTFDYWQLYVYLGIILISMSIVMVYFLIRDPKFLERRMKTKEKEKEQKIIQVVFSLFFISCFIISGFDRRFGWSSISAQIVILADFFVIIGYTIIFFTFKENSFASRVVEVEENQSVISTGLYKFIRHPMYFGIIIMYLPTSIALGSYWGLIPIATIPLAMVLRIMNEEKVLRNNLPGYIDYCEKTKHRLIPYLW